MRSFTGLGVVEAKLKPDSRNFRDDTEDEIYSWLERTLWSEHPGAIFDKGDIREYARELYNDSRVN